MNRNIGIVYRKELRDLLRDRRTIISMIVIPVIVMPLLVTALITASAKLSGKAREESPKVMIIGGEDSPQTVSALRSLSNMTWLPASPDFTNLISDKKINAAIGLPANFDDAIAAGKDPKIEVYTYQGEFKSVNAWQALNGFLQTRRDKIVGDRLAEKNLSRSVLRPFEVVNTNVASPAKVSGNVIGMVLPYLLIIMCMTGAIYPSIDLTAGEKERGTMETILCSPVARTHLVLGKGLVVLTVSLATACLALTSNGLAVLLIKKLLGGPGNANSFPLAVEPSSLLAMLVMVVPLAIFFSGVLLALGLYSRSAKEANTYFQPLLIFTVMPAAAAALPGMELNYRLALIPILNVSLAGREIMTGTFHWGYIAVVFISMCVYAGVAVAAAVALFNREDVLFRA